MVTLKKPRRSKMPRSRKKISGKKVIKKKKIPIKIKARKTRSKVKTKKVPPIIKKFEGNPILEPARNSFWQSEAVFNPATVVHDGRVHLFYRALGSEGISRIGHASSKDGIHFDERNSYPVYMAQSREEAEKHYPFTSPARLVYDTTLYASGGGWGGCEDPRAVKIGDRIYLTFNMFNGWDFMRVAFTSINQDDLARRKWNWDRYIYLSRPGDRQKNWVLFPEKINGKFAVFHNLDKGDPSRVHIAFMDKLDSSEAPAGKDAPDPHSLPDHIVAWHNRTRSAGAPPIKTKDGWLLFYHAMDKDDPNRYKVGALLLDLNDPTKVLFRSSYPILEPDEWYENNWKPGIVYVSGAVVKDKILFLYYGGGDKHIAVAYTLLEDFIKKLKTNQHAVFSKKRVVIK